MRCPHCKTKNPDNAIYCRNCDQWILAVVNREKTSPPHNDFWYKFWSKKRLLFTLSVATVLSILVLFLLPPLLSLFPALNTPIPTIPDHNTPETILANNYVICRSNIDSMEYRGKLCFIFDDRLLETDYAYATYFDTSLDGKTAAALTDDKTLLYIRNHTVTTIATDVTSFELSATGDGIAFLSTDNILCHYHIDQKYYEMIFDANPGLTDYEISPDGKTVVFFRVDAVNPTEYLLWAYQNKESTLLAIYTQSVSNLISVSNDAAYIYLHDETMIYCRTSQGSANIGLYTPGFDTLFTYANSDHTQLLFHTNDGTFLSINGQPAVCVSNELLTPISAQLTQSIFTEGTYTEPIKDFTKSLFYSYMTGGILSSQSPTYALWYMHDTSCQKLDSGITSWKIDPSGRYICYLTESEDLYLVDRMISQEPQLIAHSVTEFSATNDYSEIYYFYFNQLYSIHLQSNAQPQLVYEGFGAFTLLPAADHAMYLFQSSYVMDAYYATLLLCDQGQLKTIMPEFVTHFCAPNGQLYINTGDGYFLCAQDGTLRQLYPAAPSAPQTSIS